MVLVLLTRLSALSCALLLLCTGAAAAGHIHDEDTEAEHTCALCTSQSLSLFHDVHLAPSSFRTADGPLLPGAQGTPLCALYLGCLLSRAPPEAA